jgi:hypothetical protein
MIRTHNIHTALGHVRWQKLQLVGFSVPPRPGAAAAAAAAEAAVARGAAAACYWLAVLEVCAPAALCAHSACAAAVLLHRAAASRGWSASLLLLLLLPLLHAPHVCWQSILDQVLVLILVPAGTAATHNTRFGTSIQNSQHMCAYLHMSVLRPKSCSFSQLLLQERKRTECRSVRVAFLAGWLAAAAAGAAASHAPRLLTTGAVEPHARWHLFNRCNSKILFNST